MLRIGQGYDVHRFQEEGDLILGGVKIDFTKGLAAHSDGDVVIHALCDALLGAVALGDIGHHFPDNDPQFKDIDSRLLLRHVMTKIKDMGCSINNIDITIIAEAPKMAPHIPAMRQNIAEDLVFDINQVNVKATTTEMLGFEGRGEGIAVQAVCIIES